MNKCTLIKINISAFAVVIATFLLVSFLNYGTYSRGITASGYTKLGLPAFMSKSFTAVLIFSAVILLLVDTILHKYLRQVIHNASVDELTRLPNRKYFYKMVHKNEEKHYNESCTVFILDIDFFKQVNDTLGHGTGDLVLKEIGSILKSTVQEPNLAVRWGGDEFVGIIYGDLENARSLILRIKNLISMSQMLLEYSITVSIGADVVDPGGCMGENMLTQADKALYLSKGNGRNCITFFNEL